MLVIHKMCLLQESFILYVGCVVNCVSVITDWLREKNRQGWAVEWISKQLNDHLNVLFCYKNELTIAKQSTTDFIFASEMSYNTFVN